MEDFVFTGLHNHEQLPIGGRVSWTSDRTTRLRMMIYPVAMPDVPDRPKWNPGPPTGVEVTAERGERAVRLTDNPLRIAISRAGRPRFQATIEEFSRKNRRVALRFPVAPTARFYGLGGQFLGIEHSGKEIECQSVDAWGEQMIRQPAWANTYYPVPFVFTTDGYALLFNAAVPLRFRFPRADDHPRGVETRGVEIEVSAPALDLYWIECADPAEALQEVAAIAGRPYVPPKWALEPLIGHASDHAGKCFNQRVLDTYLEQMRRHRLPNGIIFDEAWAWTYPERDEAGSTRLWFHPEKLGDFRIHNFEPETAGIEAIHAAGQKAVLHISPYIGIESEYAPMLLEKGYLVMRASDPSLPLIGQYHHYYFDFTNPDAVAWWKDGISRLLSLGVDGFFADFGESDDQRDALYRQGTGASCGQIYSVLCRKAVYEACREARGDDFFLISRAGWTGMQQYAGALLGDQPGTFEGMGWALSAMQSLALSGQGVAAHNIGGYAGRQEGTVYLRWAQMGVFSPMFVMWNSGPTGEPWTFDEETIAHYRGSAELRMRLLPYLHSGLCEYGETGMPLIRPMALLCPHDPHLAAREDQFMCGSEILVAPIFSDDGQRVVYLPDGAWVDFWSAECLEGHRELRVSHPLGTFPVFVRRGGIVPMESLPRRTSAEERDLEIHLFGPGANRFRLHDDGAVCEIQTVCGKDALEISTGALKRPGVVFVGHAIPRPSEAAFRDADGRARRLEIVADDSRWRVRVPAGGGQLVLHL